MKVWLGSIALAGLCLSACGGGKQSSGEVEDPSSRQAAGGTAEIPWSKKTRDQKLEVMGLEVLPKMKALFTEYDSKGYASFECQTCHGTDMELVDFKLPNSLFSLSSADPIGDGKSYNEPITAFMQSRVVPEMAKILGEPLYDPATKQGFGCLTCHQSSN